MQYICLNDFNFLIPEIFFIFFLFLFFLFFLFIAYAKLYKYPLLVSQYCWVLSFILCLVIFLYRNNIFNNVLVFQSSFISNFSIINFKVFILILFICILISSLSFLKREQVNEFEYFVLLGFALFGNLMLLSTFDLILMYLVIEIQSLSLYVLVSFNKNTLLSTEAGLKYFIFGSISSIFLLAGFSLVYGVCGTLKFYDLILLNVSLFTTSVFNSFLLMGSCFIFFSFFFKLLIVPFHLWGLDVYEGAPTSVTMYLVIASKISFFLLLGRFFFYIFSSFFLYLQPILICFALGTILLSTILGLRQRRLKRLLLYSSITHTGFILFSLAVGSFESFFFMLVYLVLYLIVTFTFWVVYISIRRRGMNSLLVYLGDVKKSVFQNELLQYIVVLQLCTLAGIPPLIGFWLKALVFLGALDLYIVIPSCCILVLNIFSVFFYLRFIKMFYYDTTKQVFAIHTISKENSLFIIVFMLFIVFSFFNLKFILVFVFKFFFYTII